MPKNATEAQQKQFESWLLKYLKQLNQIELNLKSIYDYRATIERAIIEHGGTDYEVTDKSTGETYAFIDQFAEKDTVWKSTPMSRYKLKVEE